MTKPGPLMVLSQALSTDLITYTQTVSCLNFRHFDFEKQIKDRILRPLRKFCYSADTRRRSFRLVYFFHNFGVDLYFCEHNITCPFNNNFQTADVHKNRTIRRSSNIKVDKHRKRTF